MKTLRERADELGENFLNWSRAKERNDEAGEQAALDSAKIIAESAQTDGFDLNDLYVMHKADKDRLVGIRNTERLLANAGIPAKPQRLHS